MVRVICIRHSTTAGFKLTKLFGIYDFSVEKDSGKVLIIIIYCFYYNYNHNYNKILESDWFLARPIFYQIGARAAKVSNNKVSNNKVSNNKVSNNKVRVLRMRALFIWFLVVTKYFLIFLKPSVQE